MTKINNFTRPAEGKPALELSVFYDTDLSRQLFDDNIQQLLFSRNNICLAFYTDSDLVPVPEYVSDILDLRDLPEETIIEIAERFEYSRDEFPTIEELRDEIGGRHLDSLTDDAYIWLVGLPTSRYGVKTTRGYSQGDVCKVIYSLSHEPSTPLLDHPQPRYAHQDTPPRSSVLGRSRVLRSDR